jgi:hypothetical protein
MFINREPKVGETRYFVWIAYDYFWEITKVELTSVGKYGLDKDYRYLRKKVVYSSVRNNFKLENKMSFAGVYWQFQDHLRDAKRLLFYGIFNVDSFFEVEPPW